jgi:hypothetical protein
MRLLLAAAGFLLASCGDGENPAEKAAREGFPGWRCPPHTYISQRNPRYAVGPQDLPSDHPVCIAYTDAEKL